MAGSGPRGASTTNAQAIRGSARISDTRVRRVPAVTNPGSRLSVERDMFARPVHERTRAHDTRESPRLVRRVLGCVAMLVSPCWSRMPVAEVGTDVARAARRTAGTTGMRRATLFRILAPERGKSTAMRVRPPVRR